MTTTATQDLTIDLLQEGDVVLAVNGKPRPFPHIVTRVITTDGYKGRKATQVRFAHGGLITPFDPAYVVATIVAR
jgi:hypothetical protein